jgi:hypothetical protein
MFGTDFVQNAQMIVEKARFEVWEIGKTDAQI